jgi:glutamine amidotransferase
LIGIIDYGMGNLASVYNAFKKSGAENIKITSSPEDVRLAEKIVLPGVGAFEDAMKNLEKFGLISPILDFIRSEKPFLGICLGLQLLFEKSYENGSFEGLGVLKGEVVRFDINLPVPQIGWNQVELITKKGIFDNLPENAYFYFDHSYYPIVSDSSVIAAKTVYGLEYVSAVTKDNVSAVQYHPEKSHKNGLKMIENFIAL